MCDVVRNPSAAATIFKLSKTKTCDVLFFDFPGTTLLADHNVRPFFLDRLMYLGYHSTLCTKRPYVQARPTQNPLISRVQWYRESQCRVSRLDVTAGKHGISFAWSKAAWMNSWVFRATDGFSRPSPPHGQLGETRPYTEAEERAWASYIRTHFGATKKVGAVRRRSVPEFQILCGGAGQPPLVN